MDIPGPTRYNLKTKFEVNKMHGVGPSFGISHSHYEKVYNEASPTKHGWTEPGLYNIDSFVELKKKDNRKMTFAGRTPSQGDYKEARKPGPGHYNDHIAEGINKLGVYARGNHKNSLA